MGRWRRDNLSEERPEPASVGRKDLGRGRAPSGRELSHSERPLRTRRRATQMLSGNILTRPEVRRAYPYLLYLALLMFLYIAYDYRVQALHRRHDQLSKQVETLRVRSITYASELRDSTRRSKIIEEVESRGIPLQESLDPPKIIDR